MEVNAAKLAELYGKDDRTVTNWVNETPPCPSSKRGRNRFFDTAKVAQWHIERAVLEAVTKIRKEKPADEADARKRKLVAEAVLAEIAVREKESELIPADIHVDVVGELSDRLRAVAINVPSNHALDLERAGVDAATAEEVLTQIADDLTRALRGVVEEPDLEAA